MHPASLKSTSLYFSAPREVELRTEILPDLPQGHALVKTALSAISPGTEMLVYRGDFPAGIVVDETLASLAGDFAYPLRYGYAAAGEVVALGPGVNQDWIGKRVFAFQPHASHFVSAETDLHPIPDDIEFKDAVFLPNVETAVNFVMDGAPLIGERVAVLGQGIVGLLTTALLARFPLAVLLTFDRYPLRRQASLDLGAHASLDPSAVEAEGSSLAGFDLVYELSGDPAALDLAIGLCGFGSRVVIGSWYGEKRAPVGLGGKFHRNRIQLIGSQVSTLDPAHSGRWDKPRRLETAWEMLRRVRPAHLISQSFPFQEAAEAYRLIDAKPGETIQVVLTY